MSGRNGWEESAEAWATFVDEGDPHRNHLLDAAMLALAGDVQGLSVLDVGCGEGRFSRMLAERGAQVEGIEPTVALVELARQRGGGPKYIEGVGEKLPYTDGSFDLVAMYLVLIDIPNFRKAIAEAVRVLKPGGRIIVANLNGFSTANDRGWVKDEMGQRLHWPIDDYMRERGNLTAWKGIEVVNWHRPLSAYLKEFLNHGLRLTHFDEPLPTEEQLNAEPRLKDLHRAPHFCTMAWQKP